MPRTVALGDHFESFLKVQLDSGRYANASEVVRAGLRLLEDTERQRKLQLDALKRAVAEGSRSGPGRPADAVFESLERKYAARGRKG
ncbi:MAG: type II toxin-antitoxin system ParD family antitoxin [Alphaproteobacteria bacterium]|nr:type II toxin-antitoxin system ParD family antitoxin [Alphaproteobacteria bacterium]